MNGLLFCPPVFFEIKFVKRTTYFELHVRTVLYMYMYYISFFSFFFHQDRANM